MSLGLGQVCRTVGQENDDHSGGGWCGGILFNALHFNEVCFPFFTLAS